MSKIFLFLLSIAASLSAIDLDVQARGGYFYPMSGNPKRIFHGGGIYGGEVATCVMNNLQAWASVNYFTRRGKSQHFQDEHYHTRLTFLPFAVGFKGIIPLECWLDAYIGLGFQYARFHCHDESPHALEHVKKWGWGGLLKLGAIVHLNDDLFLDLFSDYSALKFEFSKNNNLVDRRRCVLDGWIFGIGVGMHL